MLGSEGAVDPYAGVRALAYHDHHRATLNRQLTTWRERALLARALRAAGNPAVVLDLPCGTGRFWPVFAAAGVRKLIGADVSESMLRVADANRPTPELPDALVRCSAFEIEMEDDAVDFIACMRFYHHLQQDGDRARALSELKRVSRGHVAISTWVDGNLKARRRRGLAHKTLGSGYGPRRCRRREEVEADFRSAGFSIDRHFDVWPGISMWRLYLLGQTP